MIRKYLLTNEEENCYNGSSAILSYPWVERENAFTDQINQA